MTDPMDNARAVLRIVAGYDSGVVTKTQTRDAARAVIEYAEKLQSDLKAVKDREWRNLPDDAPTIYLGRPQPGAAPHHYGPDDVVVDGDWLQELEETNAHAADRIEKALAKVPDDVRCIDGRWAEMVRILKGES